MWNPVRICSVSSSRISATLSAIFSRTKSPARNDFTVSSLSEHSRIALQGLKTLASLPWKRIVPHLPMYRVYAEGYLTLLLADLLPSSASADRVKTQRTWNWSKDCFSIWMPTTPKELSLDSLSKEFGVSRFVLSRIFTEKVPHHFPGLCEFQKAGLCQRPSAVHRALRDTDCAGCGIWQLPHLFPCLSGYAYHTTPGAYRRQTESSYPFPYAVSTKLLARPDIIFPGADDPSPFRCLTHLHCHRRIHAFPRQALPDRILSRSLPLLTISLGRTLQR